uniref:NADH-ubiquinone oxidoreductase chain 5 n=1 Tax=Ceratosolen solmsi TaxID=142686 RepID=I1SVF1_9HYME|nr:NADH dehydrogenase subunit 5 [Ceratosolen solmsi]
MLLYYLSSVIFLLVSIFSLLFSLMMLLSKNSYFLEWSIFMLNSVNVNMFIYVDWMSLMFMFIIMLISSSIMLYCSEYMSLDNYKNRFFFLVFFFIMSMLSMIFSPNMVSILLGWDGLGLISYLLVIYYNNQSSYNSGKLTILMNRVGDVMIMMSIGLMFMLGSWNFMNYNSMNWMILVLIMISSFTKSAQIPFSAWLPAAMAAPTPVSSLVHSSTLVTAGVYLLIRFHYLMDKNIYIMDYIKVTGLITMMLAGVSAIFEYDLKKIIAFSTLSQLGMMMMIYGMKQYELVFFHLIVHAIFKSMMFMCSGAIIHIMGDSQDIRMMGNVKVSMPLTLSILMVSSFSLCGMPFFSGYYSKDKILEFIFLSHFPYLMKLMVYFSVMLTIVYTFRMMQFLSIKINMFYPMKKWEESKIMSLSMLVLLLLTLIFGSIMKWVLFMNIEEMFMFMEDKMFFLMMCFISLLFSKFIFIYKMGLNGYLYMFVKKLWLGVEFFPFLVYYPLVFGKKFIYYYEKGWSQFLFKESINSLMSQNMSKFIYLNNFDLSGLIVSVMIFLCMMIIYY